MTPPLSDWSQLSAVSSTAAVLADRTATVTQLHPGDLPAWLGRLPAPPPEWRIANLDATATAVRPARLAVHGNGDHPTGNWDGIEAISVFTLSGDGTELAGVVRDNADRTLRDLDGDNIITNTVPVTAQAAVRSSRYFTAGAQQRVWAQYSTYLTNHPTPRKSSLPGSWSMAACRACPVHRRQPLRCAARRHRHPHSQHPASDRRSAQIEPALSRTR